MRDELLALLEERPYRLTELCSVLGRSASGLYDVLCELRAHGHVQCSRDRRTWASAGENSTSDESRSPDGDGPSVTGRQAEATNLLTPIAGSEPADSHANRNNPHIVRQAVGRSVTVDDVELEVVWDGTGPLIPWPDTMTGGSSLSQTAFGVSKGSRR